MGRASVGEREPRDKDEGKRVEVQRVGGRIRIRGREHGKERSRGCIKPTLRKVWNG